MKRFGTLFPFLEDGASPRRLGRLVANHDFIRALLRYGRYDEYLFSNPSTTNLRTFARIVEGWSLPAERLTQLRFVALPHLPAALAEHALHAMHLGGWGYFMPGLHALRARCTQAPFPITGVIHSLHGRDTLDHAVRVSVAGLAPFDAIVCTSRDGEQALRRLFDHAASIARRSFAGRIVRIPLGIDDDLLDARGDAAVVRRQLRLPEDAVVGLVLGRVTPAQKGDLAPLLATVARRVLPSSTAPLHLVVAGGATPDEVKLVKSLTTHYGLEGRVHLYVNFADDRKADLLAAADFLIAPTDNTQETFGLSLLEALGARIPVVAARYDGYKDLIEDGIDGYLITTYAAPSHPLDQLFDLVDPNVSQLLQAQALAIDLDELGDRIARLATDASLRRAMGEAGRAKVGAAYRFSSIIRRYENLWDDLAAEARARDPEAATAPPVDLEPTTLFRHYPSRRLEPTDTVVATRDAPLDPPYTEAAPLLDQAWLGSLVSAASEPIRIHDLLNRSAKSRSHTWFAVVWLIKYGALRVLPGRLSGRSTGHDEVDT